MSGVRPVSPISERGGALAKDGCLAPEKMTQAARSTIKCRSYCSLNNTQPIVAPVTPTGPGYAERKVAMELGLQSKFRLIWTSLLYSL